jgi:hypothetical protein
MNRETVFHSGDLFPYEGSVVVILEFLCFGSGTYEYYAALTPKGVITEFSVYSSLA